MQDLLIAGAAFVGSALVWQSWDITSIRPLEKNKQSTSSGAV